MIPMNAFPYIIKGKNLYLKTLASQDPRAIEDAIAVFENDLNKVVKISDIVDSLKRIFPREPDTRIINLLFYAIRVFYDFVETTSKQVLVGSKGRVWKNEWELRLDFYQWVQNSYGGFLPLEHRDEAIRQFSRDTGIPISKLEAVLSGGILVGYKVIRRIEKKPSAKEVIGVSNFLLIEKALSLSESATIKFFDVENKGRILKEILFRAKKGRILASFKIENGNLACELSGPFQIFKHPSPIYGEAIGSSIVSGLVLHDDWEIKAKVRIRNRYYYLYLSSRMSKITPIIASWSYKTSKKSIFDSSVERKVSFILKRLFPTAKVARESEILITSNGKVFIPDFTLTIGNKKILIEVVGFWTNEYAKKKKEKLDELYGDGLKNIIVLVDKKIAKYFKDAKYPTIIYDREFLIAGKLRKIIKTIASLQID